MIKYPSIEQFRNVIRTVKTRHDYKGKDENGDPIYLHDSPYPTLTFTGTVKLHGTNASIVKYKDRIEYQSRERVLSLTSDNCGFMLAMMNKDLGFIHSIEFKDHIAVYGEWCGQGIQKGVGISQLSKRFIIFGVMVDGEWKDIYGYVHPDALEAFNNMNIYFIEQFKTYSIDIDFNEPEVSQNKLVDYTIEVENKCPVAGAFGVDGIGEGIVWTCITDPTLKFKTKGEKHSVSKVTTIAAVDTEMISNVRNFVELAVTEQRLLQAISWLQENGKEVSEKSTGDFLRWIVNDVMKEEQDTIVTNQYDVKKVNSEISNKARIWFFNYINTNY